MSEARGQTPDAAPSTSSLSEVVRAGREKVEAAGATFAFEKILTTSDANGSGRIVIPKVVAEAHFPHVESQTGTNLHVVDSEGKRHTFRFRFWINNQSRMYLLEGTQDVLAKFNMGIGDVLVFGRLPDGKYVVHGRRGTKEDATRKAPGKRSGSEGGGGKGKGGSRSRGGGGGGGGGSGETTKSKRIKQTAQAQQVAASYEYWAGFSVPPRKDGVFRALATPAAQEGNRVVAQYGSWSAVVSLAGEQYQAFFDSYDAAQAALEAAMQGDLPSPAQPPAAQAAASEEAAAPGEAAALLDAPPAAAAAPTEAAPAEAEAARVLPIVASA